MTSSYSDDLWTNPALYDATSLMFQFGDLLEVLKIWSHPTDPYKLLYYQQVLANRYCPFQRDQNDEL